MVENNKFKVIHSDGHNSDTVYVFRNEGHFLDWFRNQWKKPDGTDHEEWVDMFEQWEEGNSIQDPNMDEWESFTSHYESDYTDQPVVQGGFESEEYTSEYDGDDEEDDDS